MIGFPDRRRWLPLVGATVAFVLIVAACGDDTPAATSTAATPATSEAGSEAGPAVRLEDALTAVGTRYAFTAEVTLAGVPVTLVSGTVYDGAGAYVVTAGGSDVEYVVSDEGQWAREAGGAWTVLAGAAPLADPIAPLADPLSVTVLRSDGDDARLEAVYDGGSLGFATGGDVTVTVTITDGAVSSISYEARVGEDTATVVTTFDGTGAVDPIQVPPT